MLRHLAHFKGSDRLVEFLSWYGVAGEYCQQITEAGSFGVVNAFVLFR